MNEKEFSAGIDRIEAVFGEVSAGLYQEIKRIWISYSSEIWQRMITRILETSSFMPKPKAFREAYNTILPAYKKAKGEDRCPHCSAGCGFNFVHYTYKGRYYEGVTICPQCTTYHPKPRELSEPLHFKSEDDYLRKVQEDARKHRIHWEHDAPIGMPPEPTTEDA